MDKSLGYFWIIKISEGCCGEQQQHNFSLSTEKKHKKRYDLTVSLKYCTMKKVLCMIKQK